MVQTATAPTAAPENPTAIFDTITTVIGRLFKLLVSQKNCRVKQYILFQQKNILNNA